MGWLSERLRRGGTSGNVPDPRNCEHETLSPRWRDPAAMEQPAAAMGYVCHRCHAEFLPYDVRDGRLVTHRF